ncbi:PP0621 family protein [Glaciimonas sp. GG7]
MKYVIWLVIALAVIVWFQRTKKNILHKQNKQNNQRGAAEGAHPSSLSGASPPVEEMVACVHCGLHFPASEAVTDYAGHVFCGEEHRRLHAQ